MVRPLLASSVLLLGYLLNSAAFATATQQPLHELTAEAAASWNHIEGARLTPDGRWLIYLIEPSSEHAANPIATVVLRSTQGTVERRYLAGDVRLGAGSKFEISSSGRWVAFTSALSTNDEKLCAVSIVDVETGQRTDVPKARSFEFSGLNDEWIATQEPSVSKDGEVKAVLRPAGRPTLTLRHLPSQRSEMLGAVQTFAFDKSGKHLAWVDQRGLNTRDLNSARTRLLESVPEGLYHQLTWSNRGNSLAALRSQPSLSRTTAQRIDRVPSVDVLVVFSRFSADFVDRRIFVPGQWQGFPAGYEISRTGLMERPIPYWNTWAPLTWREDDAGIFLGIRPMVSDQATDSGKGDGTSGVVLWHWKDARLPQQRKTEDALEREFGYLSYVSLSNGRFVQLADRQLPFVSIHGRGRYLLGYDSSEYSREQNISGRRYHDYYLVDLFSGMRRLLIKRLLIPASPFLGIAPQLSPDGRTVVYLELGKRGDYIAHDVEKGTRRSLTSRLSVSFYDQESLKWHARAKEYPRYPLLQGWTRDGEHVLISDYWDVWALPLQGGEAKNLTGNGRRDLIRYTRTDFSAEDEQGESFPYDEHSQYVDLELPMYFRGHAPHRRQTGLFQRVPDAVSLSMLRWEEADIRYQKAAGAEVYIYTLETAVRFPDYYRANAQWQEAGRLTDANPQQRSFVWSPGARVVSYTTAGGEALQGHLHLPAGYIPGRRYPTIVAVYNVQTERWNRYQSPSDVDLTWHVVLSIAYWTQHGYAVFYPDVQARMLQAGPAAVDAVVAGVKAAVATDIVDQERLGLTGHSEGGFNTAFIITQTTMFKAAVVQAGVTSWFAWCGGINVRKGVPRSAACESQKYLGGPWWEHTDAYLENSPLFHARSIETPVLLVHGDLDEAVPFSHSVEFFNTLRQLNKPAVLLQYAGEEHLIRMPQDVYDLTRRQQQFFDHFLKGLPAPSWWANGISTY